MTRYFFDVVGDGRTELDYVGYLFSTAKEAYETAELMAHDLVVKSLDEISNCTVEVSDADGHKLFSVPLRTIDSHLQAA
jgi:hypothetical protein